MRRRRAKVREGVRRGGMAGRSHLTEEEEGKDPAPAGDEDGPAVAPAQVPRPEHHILCRVRALVAHHAHRRVHKVRGTGHKSEAVDPADQPPAEGLELVVCEILFGGDPSTRPHSLEHTGLAVSPTLCAALSHLGFRGLWLNSGRVGEPQRFEVDPRLVLRAATGGQVADGLHRHRLAPILLPHLHVPGALFAQLTELGRGDRRHTTNPRRGAAAVRRLCCTQETDAHRLQPEQRGLLVLGLVITRLRVVAHLRRSINGKDRRVHIRSRSHDFVCGGGLAVLERQLFGRLAHVASQRPKLLLDAQLEPCLQRLRPTRDRPPFF